MPSDNHTIGTGPKTNKTVKKVKKKTTEKGIFQLDTQVQKNSKNQVIEPYSGKNTEQPKKKRTEKKEREAAVLEKVKAVSKDAARSDSSIYQSDEDWTAQSNITGEQTPVDKTVLERLMKVTAGEHHELLAPVNPDRAWFEEVCLCCNYLLHLLS